jgi:hypothetical protein
MHAPFVFSSIEPYSPVAIAVFFLFRVHVVMCLSPTLQWTCHTLSAIGSLPLSSPTGGGGATPAFSGWLVYLQFKWGVPLPHSCRVSFLKLSFLCPKNILYLDYHLFLKVEKFSAITLLCMFLIPLYYTTSYVHNL